MADEVKNDNSASEKVADKKPAKDHVAALPVDTSGDETLPEGALVVNSDFDAVQAAQPARPVAQTQAIRDEHHGKGGSYIVDPKTGERKPAFETYIDGNGKKRHRRMV